MRLSVEREYGLCGYFNFEFRVAPAYSHHTGPQLYLASPHPVHPQCWHSMPPLFSSTSVGRRHAHTPPPDDCAVLTHIMQHSRRYPWRRQLSHNALSAY